MEQKITQVYTGKAKGCRCGCNGNYFSTKEKIKAAWQKVKKWQDANEKVVVEETAAYIDFTNGNKAVTFYFG